MTPNPTFQPAARNAALPASRRRSRRKRDWGRVVARALCVAFAIVGMLPFVAAIVVRSAWARHWAERTTESALHAQGIDATYAVALRVWPLAVEMTDVRVASSDGGSPALVCNRVLVQPKIFALLAGKLAIDKIDLDGPRVRAVIRDGQIANLSFKIANNQGSTHAPFSTFAVTDGTLDLDVDGTRVGAQAIDADVTTDDDPAAGSSFEVALRAGRAGVNRPRATPGSSRIAIDDDALCAVEGRVRIEPHAVLVRRLEGSGSLDLDAAPGTMPPCDLPESDKRRFEVSLGHVRVALSQDERKLPAVDGHVHVRVPIALAERLASLPETDGWIALDADTRYADDTILPDANGTIEAHDVRLAQYGFAQELAAKFEIRKNVVRSSETVVRLAGGTVTITDAVVDPLAKGARLEQARVDIQGVDFTSLLGALGVHPHSWVGWELREVHMPAFRGTFVPLRLDGDFNAKTYHLGVYDRPAEDRSRERLFGIAEAQVAAHLAIRPDSVRFQDTHVTMPRSRIEGGLVSLGFHNALVIEAPRILVDFDDISPIGPVPLKGKGEVSTRVGGTMSRPEIEGDIKSIASLGVADVSFGDVSAGHVKVDVTKPEVELTGVRAKKRDSAYEVATARLKFGSAAQGFAVDAVGTSGGFGLRDLLSMFALDDDPRFDGFDATIATRADVHVALGGPEDACGAGFLSLDAKGHLTRVRAFGEKFAQGDADLSLKWYDRLHGIAGADVDVRSFVLDKVQPPSGTRVGATGTILGSASIRRGGALSASVVAQGVPLSRIDSLGTLARQADGSVSGVAHVTGNLDDFLPGAGLVARAEVDVAGTRIRSVALPGSHLDVGVTQRMPQQRRIVGRTKCGTPIGAPFDRQAFLADASSRGEWTIGGDLLSGTVHLSDVVLTRAKSPHVSGRVSLRGLDLGALAQMRSEARAGGGEPVAAAAAPSLGGQLWGEVIVDDVPLDAPDRSRARILLGPTVVSRGGQKLTLKPPSEPLRIEDDKLAMPPLEVTLDTPEGFRGGFVVSGGVANVTGDPTLGIEARLEPVDLAVLPRLVSRVERASGRLEGALRVTGKVSAPAIEGELRVALDDAQVHGLPSAITDARIEARANAGELSASGQGKFGGGTVAFEGTMPIRGFDLGALAARIAARGVRLTPADGVAATFDADLALAYDPSARTDDPAGALPHVSGDVTLASFDYTRPIALTTDLTALGSRAKRTEIVSGYDPALDALAFDLRLHNKSPIAIRNNLAEVQLVIDSGSLDVSGTNQRMGLRGALRAVPGGRFHFQANDFDVRQAIIHFDDPTRIAPNVDIVAVTEYRRYTDTGAGTGAGPTAASAGGTRGGGSLFRIQLHAFGDADNLRVEMTSEPALSQEDIVLLLTAGMTRAELDQLGATSLGASVALNVLGQASGASGAVKKAVPLIDDFRFGSAYSTVTGKTEPQLTLGKRLTRDIRASVTTGLSEDRELRSNIEWRLNNRLSVQGSYDNINDVSSSALGNLGVDLRWRLEFE